MEKPISPMKALVLSIFIVIFNLSTAMTASTYIISDLGGGLDIFFYDFSLFAIGNAVGLPLGKLFIGKDSAKYLLRSCYALFFFSLMCGFSANYPIFLIMRFLQGFFSGPIIPLQQTICTLSLPEEKQKKLTKISSILFALGPIFGSAIGGWIAYESHWRWLFFLNIPLMIPLLYLIRKNRDVYNIVCEKKPFDFVGYTFYSLGLLGTGLALTMSQNLDWQRSPLFMTLLITGVISLGFFCTWEYVHPDPLLGIKVLKQKGKLIFTSIVMVVFALYFGSNFLVSKWLNFDANYTPLWIAGLFGYSILAGTLMFFFISKLFGTKNPLAMLFLSLILLTASNFYCTQFDVTINFGRILFAKILESVGFALFLFPILQLTLEDVAQERKENVLNIFHITRTFFTGIGGALFPIIWERRRDFYHERLGEEITNLSPKTDMFFGKIKEYFIEGAPANAELSYALNQQASTLALEDVFFLIGWLFVSLIIFLILSYLRKRLQTPQASLSDQ